MESVPVGLKRPATEKDRSSVSRDGLGPLTHDMCGDEEHIEVESLAPRTALLAGIISPLVGPQEND